MYGTIHLHATAKYPAVIPINRRIAEAAPRYHPTRASDRAPDSATVHVTTLLNRSERWAVDVSGEPWLRYEHRDSLSAVGQNLVAGSADAVLISSTRSGPEIVPELGKLVRAFPAHVFAGLVSGASEVAALNGTLRLGRAGVRSVVDVRRPEGWKQLRRLFNSARVADAFMRSAVASILAEIAAPARQANGSPAEGTSFAHTPSNASRCASFFRAVFSPDVRIAREVAARFGVPSSTLVSRFYRAGLPSPKKYLAYARLVWAAHLGECPGLSISAIANRLNASSPQSFNRCIHLLMGMRATEFRAAFDGPRMLDRFRATLVTPYRERLRTFDPMGGFVAHRVSTHHSTTIRARPAEAQGPAARVARVA